MSALTKTLLLVPLIGAPAAAQTVTGVTAEHRSGQTFVTWNELPQAGTSYRVYRSTTRLRSDGDLDKAELLGEVDDRSSRNAGRTFATGTEQTWVITDGGAPLRQDVGLFVYTVERSESRVYYAVTTVRGGQEDPRVDAGQSATDNGLNETVAVPQPVLQLAGPGLELWAHWVGDRDTPFQPALSPWPSSGFNFLFQPGSAPGPRGLMVSLHAAGQTYAQGWPQRFELPDDVDLLLMHDLAPYTGWTFWFGGHDDLPGVPSGPDTRIWNHTQQRVLWTLDWMEQRLGAQHDPERVYVGGGSMGAIGGMYLASEAPERFAAVLLRNGLYDLKASDYRNPAAFQRMFGDFKLNLLTRDGIPILDRTNATTMAGMHPEEDWPVLRTIGGRLDETVGWSSYVGLMRGLARVAARPAIHYFDDREHNPVGYWRTLERALISRTCKVRRDLPSMRFDACSLDDDPGHGERLDGDLIGTVNAYVEYDPETAQRSPDELVFDVYLRDKGALDDAPADRGWARMTPCRTGPFQPAPGEPVRYSLEEDGVLVDEHLLFADAHGRVQTPRAPIGKTARVARFLRAPALQLDDLFVGEAPMPGDDLQVVLHGAPGAPWILVASLHGAGLKDGSVILSGIVGDDGFSRLVLPLPELLRPGGRIAARARIDGAWGALEVVTLQRRWTPKVPARAGF